MKENIEDFTLCISTSGTELERKMKTIFHEFIDGTWKIEKNDYSCILTCKNREGNKLLDLYFKKDTTSSISDKIQYKFGNVKVLIFQDESKTAHVHFTNGQDHINFNIL